MMTGPRAPRFALSQILEWGDTVGARRSRGSLGQLSRRTCSSRYESRSEVHPASQGTTQRTSGAFSFSLVEACQRARRLLHPRSSVSSPCKSLHRRRRGPVQRGWRTTRPPGIEWFLVLKGGANALGQETNHCYRPGWPQTASASLLTQNTCASRPKHCYHEGWPQRGFTKAPRREPTGRTHRHCYRTGWPRTASPGSSLWKHANSLLLCGRKDAAPGCDTDASP